MPHKLSQFEWLMLHLDQQEALELRAAKDALMSRHLDEQAACPLFWLEDLTMGKSDLLVSEMLSVGFIWNRSPQGHAYWQAVHDKYKALESLKRRREEDDG